MRHSGSSRRLEPPPSIAMMMLLVAALALGLWLVLPSLQGNDEKGEQASLLLTFLLGGASLIGPPLLLWTARGKLWGAGRLLWFSSGISAWLLWPPIIHHRVTSDGRFQGIMSPVCFLYGTPLMAVYMTFALLAGGHLRRARRRRFRRSWQEVVGLLIGMIWACIGLYWIASFYRGDILKK